MLGLVVGGIVLALGLGYFQTSQSGAQVQATVSEIGTIIGSAQQNYGQYGYSGMTTTVAIGSRVIPESRSTDGKTATDVYSGDLTLEDNSSKQPDTARLTYEKVPAAQCAQIANGTHPLTRQMLIGGVEVKPLDGKLDIAKAVTQCTAGSSTSIEFVFGRT